MELDTTGKPTNASKWSPKRYRTEEAALLRVDSLKVYGVWPGVVRYRNGEFGLTYDPSPSIVGTQRAYDQ